MYEEADIEIIKKSTSEKPLSEGTADCTILEAVPQLLQVVDRHENESKENKDSSTLKCEFSVPLNMINDHNLQKSRLVKLAQQKGHEGWTSDNHLGDNIGPIMLNETDFTSLVPTQEDHNRPKVTNLIKSAAEFVNIRHGQTKGTITAGREVGIKHDAIGKIIVLNDEFRACNRSFALKDALILGLRNVDILVDEMLSLSFDPGGVTSRANVFVSLNAKAERVGFVSPKVRKEKLIVKYIVETSSHLSSSKNYTCMIFDIAPDITMSVIGYDDLGAGNIIEQVELHIGIVEKACHQTDTMGKVGKLIAFGVDNGHWIQSQAMNEDLTRMTSDLHQIPAIRSEIEGLKQELQRARAAIEYEKKGYAENYEHGQLMDIQLKGNKLHAAAVHCGILQEPKLRLYLSRLVDGLIKVGKMDKADFLYDLMMRKTQIDFEACSKGVLFPFHPGERYICMASFNLPKWAW